MEDQPFTDLHKDGLCFVHIQDFQFYIDQNLVIFLL